MNEHRDRKNTALAALITLALGCTPALAATPAADQLPGMGRVVSGTVGTPSAVVGGAQSIGITSNAVINWGDAAGTLNTGQPPGFNIGPAAALTFDGNAGANSVLNIDSSGSASQILGKLGYANGTGNLFVANANGIIVGSAAQISSTGGVMLIANTLGSYGAFDGTTSPASVEYAGTGGDVTVAKGALVGGSAVLVSGGGQVNVDLGAFTGGTLALNAGLKNSTSSLVQNNAQASLAVAGALAGATLGQFASAGNASNGGDLTLGGNAAVAGTLTNDGNLDLGPGFHIAGALVNDKAVTVSLVKPDYVQVGSLTNNGTYDGVTGTGIGVNSGDLVNRGSFMNMSNLVVYHGGINNSGSIEASGSLLATNADFVNNGQITGPNWVGVYTGDFINNGAMQTVAPIDVINGNIVNNGTLSVANRVKITSSAAYGGFTAGADYSITNSGTLTFTGNATISANSDNTGGGGSFVRSGTGNNTTGSIRNTGTLQLGPAGSLVLQAYNDVNLGGTVQVQAGGTYTTVSAGNPQGAFQVQAGGQYTTVSAGNPLGSLKVYAADYVAGVQNADGVVTLASDVAAIGGIDVHGSQIRLMGNLANVDATGAPAGTINLVAGAALSADYAVRVASGRTVSAATIQVNGAMAGDYPNVIVQGELAGAEIDLGTLQAVSDVVSGPAGRLLVTGANPLVNMAFTGRIKTAPYLNDAGNFRFNYLPISLTDAATRPLQLTLNPVSYETHGTSNGLSAVNILVDGDVSLVGPATPPQALQTTAVTGVTSWESTHLVLQSTGDIGTSAVPFYWPGYVYLGNIGYGTDGLAAPGTLGTGSITLSGGFNNVLPGNVDGGGGIHFITAAPLTVGTGATVTTNANSWVNFGADLLTQAYATGLLGQGLFLGGVQGPGKVVLYDLLDASMFHTQAPNANR